MYGDNFSVRVASEGMTHFDMAVRMAFGSHKKATHYLSGLPKRSCLKCSGSGKGYGRNLDTALKESVVYRCNRCDGYGTVPPSVAMILLWHEESHAGFASLPLPFPLTIDAAVPFLWNFLETALYPDQPDHDGSNGKGFMVTTGDFWGHVEGMTYSILSVEPDWQMYGK